MRNVSHLATSVRREENRSSKGGQDLDGLRELDQLRAVYIVPRDDLVHEVLIPALKRTDRLACMFGYFGSGALADLAPGLSEYLAAENEPVRLLVSPHLEPGDLEAIREGVSTPAEILEARLVDLIGEATISEMALVRHTLECLSYLLAAGRLDVRVALMRDGMFHDKVWFFGDGSDRLVVSGSSNMTRSGLLMNHEQVRVEKSWGTHDQKSAIDELTEEFEALWESRRDYAVCIDLPVAVRERLLKEFHPESPPDPRDFELAWRHDYLKGLAAPPTQPPDYERPRFAIPSWLEWQDGDYAHQGAAVAAWEANNYRGVLEMATGAGKTITSLIGTHRRWTPAQGLLVVVGAPSLPLVGQWRDECRLFGLDPIVPGGGRRQKLADVQAAISRLAMKTSEVEALIVTHNLLCDPEFQQLVSSARVERLLIADEVHNLGREAFLDNRPEFFEYRLGLSATPVRQYDPEGTQEVFDFFGPVVYRFGLEDAIGTCLVPYDYYIHPVRLSHDEMDDWRDLTLKIKQQAWKIHSDDPNVADDMQRLLNRRRKILESAGGKLAVLRGLLQDEQTVSTRHTLVYTTDKGPEQLENVNALLGDIGLRAHQLTSAETQDGRLVARVVEAFRSGAIQVLTAKRVLDEGVNIPEIAQAFILASTTVERQWVQRRGRLLRRCDAIGKDHAVIHDFVVLPPPDDGIDEDTRKLLRGEFDRLGEFARLARNNAAAGGPRDVLRPIVLEYFG